MDNSLDALAKTCFDFFNSWVKAGFTEDQAMRMVIIMMIEMQKDYNPMEGLNDG